MLKYLHVVFQPPTKQVSHKPLIGGRRFDWFMIMLYSWLIGGVYLDGWVHYHKTIIESFFTPWHAALYSGFAAIAITLIVVLLINRHRGAAWGRALPAGYELSLLGVCIFAVGGLGDMIWHILFGFEVDLEALMSPTHIVLAVGGALIVSGALRAAWVRSDGVASFDWSAQLPALLSLAYTLCIFTFMTLFAHPFVDIWASPRYHVTWGAWSQIINEGDQIAGMMSIILQTALLMGTLLVAIRRWKLQPGALVLIFTLNLTLVCLMEDRYFLLPAAVLAGLGGDILMAVLKPSINRPGSVRLFAFLVPVLLYMLYFLDLDLFYGIWWSIHLWLGAIVFAGIVGLLLSYVLIPPLKERGQAELIYSKPTSVPSMSRAWLTTIAPTQTPETSSALASHMEQVASLPGARLIAGTPEQSNKRRSSGVKAALLVVIVLLVLVGNVELLSSPVGGWIKSLTTTPTPEESFTVQAECTPLNYSYAPQPALRTDISMFGSNPQHTRMNPNEQVLSVKNVSQLKKNWCAMSSNGIYSSPAIVNGVVYVGSQDNTIYAIKASTGDILWAVPTQSAIESSPAIVNGIVYIGSDDGHLYALNATTGDIAWTAATNNSVYSSPVVVKGVVYIGSEDWKLYAFNATTGKRVWTAQTKNQITSSPAVADGLIYVGSQDGYLYAFNATNGKPVWKSPTGSSIYSSPTVTNGVVYVGSWDTDLYAFNARTGNPLWTASTGSYINSSPAVANGIVYVGSMDHKLYAFNARTGQQQWAVPTRDVISSSPTVANGVIYVGSDDGGLYAFNAQTGKKLWSYFTGSVIYSSPTVANGTVYVGSANNKLYAFSLPAR